MRSIEGKLELLFLIDSLSAGGAQQQLFELVKGLDRNRFNVRIISWYPGSFYSDLKEIKGVELIEIKRKSRFDLRPLKAAFFLIKSGKVHILHAYLDSACFYGAVCKFFFRRLIFIATERSSFKHLTFLQKIHKPISHYLANLTVTNSNAGAKYLEKLGVKSEKVKLIRNGINTDQLLPSIDRIEEFKKKRTEFPPDSRMILMAGRITKLKNQLLVLEAYNKSLAKDNFIMVMVGNMDVEYGLEVRDFINQQNLNQKIFILSASNEIPLYYNISELVVLFSDYEGSPNVILEAMASGRTVISSDVGDVKYFVDNSFGWILPVRDCNALINTFNLIAQMSTKELLDKGKLALEKFNELQLSTSAMVSSHMTLYSELTSD